MVKLASWLAEKHARYVKQMGRMQTMSANVLIVEKNQRQAAHAARKLLLGYDPEKWLDADLEIRNEGEGGCTFKAIQLPPPLKGKHKYGLVRALYNDIHKFIGQRKWAAAPTEGNTTGIIWLEMCVLFDISGARTARADHVKGQRCEKEGRREKLKSQEAPAVGRRQRGQAIIKPALQ